MSFRYKAALLIAFGLCGTTCFSQNKCILHQNFDSSVKGIFIFENLTSSCYMIHSYSAGKKLPPDVASDCLCAPYDRFYVENGCADTINQQHKFYVEITLLHKGIPNFRDMLVLKLDTTAKSGMAYELSFEARYHQFCDYRVDSIQVLLLEKESDIKLFLAERPFKGRYVQFPVQAFNNSTWQQARAEFSADANYSYLVIGNLQTDEDTQWLKNDSCKGKREKANWKHSELFIDNIFIAEKKTAITAPGNAR